MKAQPSSPRRLGITRRIALLSWVVTSVTLVIFLCVIIPQQKRTYLENLESKARGVSASIQQVTAGAAVTQDYDVMQAHCMEVLQADRSISFLVITKNDGFSLAHHTVSKTNSATGGLVPMEPRWSMETLGEEWHPARRQIRSGIDTVALFNERVFRYTKPFDYSGIEWGWIHVGLSLDAYDRSVQGVYQRTGLLAVVCLLFSLGASVVYARRLVQPLHDLNDAVSQVTSGDLSARADIRSGDEIQDLAQSFNTMTEALLQRDRILESVRIAAQRFLTSPDWRQVINGVLAQIGQSAAFSRVYVFENHLSPHGGLLSSLRYEWAAPGVASHLDNPALQGFAWPGAGFQATAARLQQGETVAQRVCELSPQERALMDPRAIDSALLVPIAVEGKWWGFLGLDECARQRQWTDGERDSLRTAAEMLGAAIARYRTQQALLEAKELLEQRVVERTRQLEEQMAAKEKAHGELAEAQQRLMISSRLAGMAEVATNVLHNVGNVLNSVNVSCTLVLDGVRQSQVASLSKLADLLVAHEDDLGRFFASDPKGRQIPKYLSALVPVLMEERSVALNELNSLREKVDHIKEIVAMQQGYARVSGVIETLPVEQLVRDAVKLNAGAMIRHRVELQQQFDPVAPIATDRHKVLQILLNLIRNAKYACDEGGRLPKTITVRVYCSRPGHVALEVADNGIGIAPENLTRIFSHGFTTRKDGHGFGLHSGVLAARQLGGSLRVQSAGLGQGAVFTLELPYDNFKTESLDDTGYDNDKA